MLTHIIIKKVRKFCLKQTFFAKKNTYYSAHCELMNRECFVVCYSMNRNDEEENDGMIK